MSGGRASRLVAMEGELLLYTNPLGHAPGGDDSVLGLYYRDTRHLSRMELLLGGRPPVVLTSSAERGYSETVELTNLELRGRRRPPPAPGRGARAPHAGPRRQAVRARARAQPPPPGGGPRPRPALRRRLRRPVRDPRAASPAPRPLRPPEAAGATLTFAYDGLDEVSRTTVVTFHRPAGVAARRAGALSPAARARRARRAALRPSPSPRTRRPRSSRSPTSALGARPERGPRRGAPRARALGGRGDGHLHRQRAAERGAAPRPGRPAHADDAQRRTVA